VIESKKSRGGMKGVYQGGGPRGDKKRRAGRKVRPEECAGHRRGDSAASKNKGITERGKGGGGGWEKLLVNE